MEAKRRAKRRVGIFLYNTYLLDVNALQTRQDDISLRVHHHLLGRFHCRHLALAAGSFAVES
jgi:hypothetical protein